MPEERQMEEGPFEDEECRSAAGLNSMRAVAGFHPLLPVPRVYEWFARKNSALHHGVSPLQGGTRWSGVWPNADRRVAVFN